MRKHLFLWTILVPALFSQSPPVVAIRNARVHPVSGAVIENGSVVIQDGKIVAVSASVSRAFSAREPCSFQFPATMGRRMAGGQFAGAR